MKTSIKKFLADLYEIDPTLQAHETEMIPLLEKLIAEDPSTAPNDAFVQKLRMQLREHAGTLEEKPATTFWQKFSYVLSGGLTVTVILPIAFMLTNQHPIAAPGAPLFSNSVQATGKNAFGSLNDIAVGSVPVGIDERNARPQGGGGGPAGATMNAVAPTASAPMVDQKMMMPWNPVTYTYVYSGALADLQSTVSVYKRQFNPITMPISTLADRLNFGGINMGSFDGMNIDSVSFTQQTQYGYSMYVNMRDGSLSIDANYEKWPQSQCQTDACYKAQLVKISDVLPDADAIAIAQAFAKDHGIDLSIYGTPEVDNSWKTTYDLATDKSLVYIPDQQRVIFPQLIDGKPVYDQSGLKTGMSISVNVKAKKVMSVYGIGDHSYLKSDYAGVTDEAAIQKYLSTVDNYGSYLPAANVREGDVKQPEAKKVTVVLGTPTVSYAMYYRYTNQRNDELLIPSLVFPVDHVEGDTTNAYYRQQVVVPLSQEMLEEMSKRPDVMPMLQKGGVMMDAPAKEPGVVNQ